MKNSNSTHCNSNLKQPLQGWQSIKLSKCILLPRVPNPRLYKASNSSGYINRRREKIKYRTFLTKSGKQLILVISMSKKILKFPRLRKNTLQKQKEFLGSRAVDRDNICLKSQTQAEKELHNGPVETMKKKAKKVNKLEKK